MFKLSHLDESQNTDLKNNHKNHQIIQGFWRRHEKKLNWLKENKQLTNIQENTNIRQIETAENNPGFEKEIQ